MSLKLQYGFQLFLLSLSVVFLFIVFLEEVRSQHKTPLVRCIDETGKLCGSNKPLCLQRWQLLLSGSVCFDKLSVLQYDAQCTQQYAHEFTDSLDSAATTYLRSEQCAKRRGALPVNPPFGQGRRSRCSGLTETSAFKKEVGGALVVSAKHKVIYVPNMKVASQLFRTVMERRLAGQVMNQNSLRKFLIKHNHSLEEYFVFTFVRNPLSHFISAYAELDKRASTAMERPGMRPRGFLKLHRNATNEPRRALSALQDIGVGRFQGLTPAHMYTQFWKISRCLSRSRVPLIYNFIGKIEHLARDWRAIETRLGVPHEPLKKIHAANSPAKAHAKKIDLFGVRHFPLLKEVCSYYREDFDCFDYSLPKACRNETVTSAV